MNPALFMNDKTWQVRGPRSRQAREAKRLMLLQTAARMFNERGFENTSLTDIAETLGITKPSLYYYVKNKEAIFLGIFEITRKKLLQVKNEAQQAHLTGLDQLRAFMDTYIDLSTGDLGKCVIRMNSIVLSEDNARALEKMKREIDSVLQDILMRGVEDGTLKTRSPEIAASAIFGAMNWLVFWHKPGKKLNQEKIREIYLQTFLKGLEAEA
jgi:AcrR family transcriptional regulator